MIKNKLNYLALGFVSTIILSSCGSTPTIPTSTVSFQTDGGTTYHNLVVNVGDNVTLPTPNKPGHFFEGWYDNETFNGDKITEQYEITEDTVFYAKWKKHPVVTFETFGGTEFDPLIYSGTPLDLPTEVFKYDYKFNGWYDNKEYKGEKISAPYTPKDDVTLYANYIDVTYIYMYYGDGFEFKKFEATPGDTISLDKIYEMFVPESLKVTDGWGDEYIVPFNYWAVEQKGDAEDIKLESDLVVGNETIVLNAVYDYSEVPPAVHMTRNEDNSYTTTGKVAHPLIDENFTLGTYSIDVEFIKGVGGGCGPAFRMDMPNLDYQYEANSSYISAVVTPANGGIQISAITNGKFSHLSGSPLNLAGMPLSWRNYYNEAAPNSRLKVTVKVVVTENKFRVYYNNYGNITTDQIVYSLDMPNLSEYVGTGFGVRSSHTGATFSNIQYSKEANIDPNEVLVKMEYDDRNNSYVTTGKIAHPFVDENSKNGTLSVDLRIKKGGGGAVGPSFRMKMPNLDYQYEKESYYLAATICPNDGALQVCKVANKFAHLKGSKVSLAKLPASWNEFYTNTPAGGYIDLTMKVVINDNDFMVYLSNYGDIKEDQLAYQYSTKYTDNTVLNEFDGTGFGVRSSHTGAIISNIKYIKG